MRTQLVPLSGRQATTCNSLSTSAGAVQITTPLEAGGVNGETKIERGPDEPVIRPAWRLHEEKLRLTSHSLQAEDLN